MENISLHAFNGLTGAHVARLPCGSASWADAINDAGTLTATVTDPNIDFEGILRVYGTIVAAIGFGRVIHAGYLKHVKRNGKEWSIDAGGGASIFDKRLVINYRLHQSWADGTVIVDEDNPSGNWPFTVTGSYSDLISKLISESLKFGALPIVPAALTGGDKLRTYNSYDLATVSDRIKDIGDLENGPEYRFDAVVDDFGAISFLQRTSKDGGEIIDHHWKWNAIVPDSGVILGEEDADGSEMCTQSFGVGGKSEDKIVVARSISNALTAKGWPVLQNANTSHSSISNTATLKSYVNADTACGDNPQHTYGLEVDMSRYDVRVGDWCDVRRSDREDDVLLLKVTNVSGSVNSRMATIQCRERI